MYDNNLKFCRESLGMTQKELGHIFDLAESTISGWENNNDTIPLPKLIRFCNLYDFSIDFVLGISRKNTLYNKIQKIDKKYIGSSLKKLRKELKMTQKQIADECSISQTTYSNYELGITLITTLTLYTICKNHNLSVDQFLGRKIIE